MSNLNTFVKVTINGEEKTLKFDYNAACDLEDIYGKGIANILSEEQVGFRLVRSFYWAGLKWKDRGLTLPVVGNWLNKEIVENGGTIAELMKPVMDALKKSKLLSTGQEETEDEQEGEESPNE